jgi:DNA-binding LytR/AlgR family response regulator
MRNGVLPKSLRYWAVDLAIATAAGLFLGLIGPFGSYFNGPLWQRAAFQIACFWLGTLIYGVGIRLLVGHRFRGAALWIAVVTLVAILTWPFSLLIAALARAIWPFLAWLSPMSWYVQGLITAEPSVIGLTLLALHRLHRDTLADEAIVTASEPSATGGLLGVRPHHVLCLQMEDHYVRVHHQAGSRLVLATLGQAIAELGTVDGRQVHRSWWVARKAVAAAEIEGRNLRLRLTNGVSAPVARASVAPLRAAGWIAPQ